MHDATSSSNLLETDGQLAPPCIPGLRKALNPHTGIYDRQLRNQRWASTSHAEKLTSTCICLIGIDRAGLVPDEMGLDRKQTLEGLIALGLRQRNHSGLGLLIWANAVSDGLPLQQLLSRLNMSMHDLPRFTAPLSTMEVAWLASGLIHEWMRSDDPATKRLIDDAIEELTRRYCGGSQLMVHTTQAAPIKQRLRKWIANFADQIYAVQALTFFAITQNDDRSRSIATDCATRLVELQGPLGQWWWHYDTRSGQVAQAYAVYSVHQHSMAPMALAALAAAGGPSFHHAADLGYRWLSNNELGVHMLDAEAETTWRDIGYDEGRLRRFARKLRSVPGWAQTDPSRLRLKVNYETRPYEWGWRLYAGAIEAGTQSGRHVV